MFIFSSGKRLNVECIAYIIDTNVALRTEEHTGGGAQRKLPPPQKKNLKKKRRGKRERERKNRKLRGIQWKRILKRDVLYR